jgi:hypothetical protein
MMMEIRGGISVGGPKLGKIFTGYEIKFPCESNSVGWRGLMAGGNSGKILGVY